VIKQLRHEPVAPILSRQNLPRLDRTIYSAVSDAAKGADVLADADNGQPDVLLLASGSELSLCVDAYEQLKAEAIQARVVSMPSWELFELQSNKYRESVIPLEVTAGVSVELASTLGWARYLGLTGCSIGMETFAASAPLQELQKKFGFNLENVVGKVKKQLKLTGI
jgi:transketolase